MMRANAFTLLVFSPMTIACTPADVTISGTSGSIDRGYLTVVGTLVHRCPHPAGVQLKLSIFDKKGNLIDVHDQWPASINNIAPNAPYNFRMMGDKRQNQSRFTVEPIAVKQWK